MLIAQQPDVVRPYSRRNIKSKKIVTTISSSKNTKKRARAPTSSRSDTEVKIIQRKQHKKKENTAREQKTDDIKRFMDKQNEFNNDMKKMELKEKAEARKERERER